MTVVPLKIYFRDGIAKCELAVAQGQEIPRPPRVRTAKRSEARSRRSDVSLAPALKVKGRHADPTRELSRTLRFRPTHSLPTFLTKTIEIRWNSRRHRSAPCTAVSPLCSLPAANSRARRSSLSSLHFPEGLGRQAAAACRGREARKIRAVGLAQDCRNRAALLEIARREEVYFPCARRRTRACSRAGRRRRTWRRRFRIEQVSAPTRKRIARSSRCCSPVSIRGLRMANLPEAVDHGRVIARIAEFRARFDQRAFQPPDAPHARGARRGHGQGSRPRRRNSRRAKDRRAEDGRADRRRAGKRRAAARDRAALHAGKCAS